MPPLSQPVRKNNDSITVLCNMCTVTEESVLNKRVSLSNRFSFARVDSGARRARDPSITLSRGGTLLASPPVLGTAL